MKREAVKKRLKETQSSYDKMAREFSDSRSYFWEELSFLAHHVERDDHVIDIGCGNGRFAPLVGARHAHYDGLDYSEGLIDEARQKFPDYSFTKGDATKLPYPENSFDIAYSFAMIHHLPGKELRKQFIRETYRVLHPGGKLIITAWDIWSPRYFGKIFTTALTTLFGLTDLDIGDVMLTFGTKKYPRYIHAFTLRELNALLIDGGFTVIAEDAISRKSGQRNLVIIATKSRTE